MLFSRTQSTLAMLTLGLLISSQTASAFLNKETVGALVAGGTTLYLLKHKESTNKNRGHVGRALDLASHVTKSAYSLAHDHLKELAFAGAVAWLVYHNRDVLDTHAVHHVRRFLGRHKPVNP